MRDLEQVLWKYLFDIREREQALSPRRKFLATGTYLRVPGVACSGDWQHSRRSDCPNTDISVQETSVCRVNALECQKQPRTQHVVSLGLYQGESWACGKARVLLNYFNHSSGFPWLSMPVHAALGQVYTALTAAFSVGWLCWLG